MMVRRGRTVVLKSYRAALLLIALPFSLARSGTTISHLTGGIS